MFINRKNWLVGAAAAAAITASAATWSMGPGGSMGPRGGDHDPGRMLAHMADQLDLSSEQKATVESLLSASRQGNEANRQRLQELREELMAMHGNFDADRAQQIANEIGEITGSMVFAASKTWSEVYKVLDEEQRQELDELMAKRQAQRGKWRKGGSEPDA